MDPTTVAIFSSLGGSIARFTSNLYYARKFVLVPFEVMSKEFFKEDRILDVFRSWLIGFMIPTIFLFFAKRQFDGINIDFEYGVSLGVCFFLAYCSSPYAYKNRDKEEELIRLIDKQIACHLEKLTDEKRVNYVFYKLQRKIASKESNLRLLAENDLKAKKEYLLRHYSYRIIEKFPIMNGDVSNWDYYERRAGDIDRRLFQEKIKWGDRRLEKRREYDRAADN